MTQIEPKMGYFGTQLKNHTYKFLTFLLKGRGISVEKTGEACHSWKIQNWGFQTIFVVPSQALVIVTAEVSTTLQP